jgi:hypothetical protein
METTLDVPAVATEVVKRQTLKGSKEFAVLEDFEVTSSQARKTRAGAVREKALNKLRC